MLWANCTYLQDAIMVTFKQGNHSNRPSYLFIQQKGSEFSCTSWDAFQRFTLCLDEGRQEERRREQRGRWLDNEYTNSVYFDHRSCYSPFFSLRCDSLEKIEENGSRCIFKLNQEFNTTLSCYLISVNSSRIVMSFLL